MIHKGRPGPSGSPFFVFATEDTEDTEEIFACPRFIFKSLSERLLTGDLTIFLKQDNISQSNDHLFFAGPFDFHLPGFDHYGVDQVKSVILPGKYF
jgi:hypothetical protein